jgi:hypothetical protein
MNKNFKATLAGFFILMAFPGLAMADVVQGRVAGIYANAIDMTVYDAQGRPYPNIIRLKTDSGTRLNGFTTAAIIKKNDPLQIELREESAGVWRADSITRLVSMNPYSRPSMPQSNSLMDALRSGQQRMGAALQSEQGQKAVRGGLQGAVVGALASAASGGKTLKGALVGAGTGILGGLFGDVLGQVIFGQGGQQPSAPNVATYPDSRN